MRSAARLRRTPREFRSDERARSSAICDQLLRELAAAAARGDEWYVWVRDEWPKLKAPRP